jgi:hypothetical protein
VPDEVAKDSDACGNGPATRVREGAILRATKGLPAEKAANRRRKRNLKMNLGHARFPRNETPIRDRPAERARMPRQGVAARENAYTAAAGLTHCFGGRSDEE